MSFAVFGNYSIRLLEIVDHILLEVVKLVAKPVSTHGIVCELPRTKREPTSYAVAHSDDDEIRLFYMSY